MHEAITTIPKNMSQISNLIPSDRRTELSHRTNKGPADHSKVEIAEGKAKTKKLVYKHQFLKWSFMYCFYFSYRFVC